MALSMDMPVLEMDANPEKAKARVMELGCQAVENEGVEVIVLGCAGLSGYAEDIERAGRGCVGSDISGPEGGGGYGRSWAAAQQSRTLRQTADEGDQVRAREEWVRRPLMRLRDCAGACERDTR